MTSATLGQPALSPEAFPPGQEGPTQTPRMDRRFAIVAAVTGFHVLALWALQAGLLRRAVELVVPVTVLADLVEPPQPLVAPEPEPPRPQPTLKPVTPVQPVAKQAPVPLAIPDPAPVPQAPAGVLRAPPEPLPAITEPATSVAVAPLPPPTAPASNVVTDNFKALPPPPYPVMSNRLKEQGSVHLDIRIEADGTATSALVTRSSGYLRLDEAAVKAALGWRYVLRNGGAPRPDTYQHVIRFELN